MEGLKEIVLDRIEMGLRLFGHLMRVPESSWVKRVFKWFPSSKKNKVTPLGTRE